MNRPLADNSLDATRSMAVRDNESSSDPLVRAVDAYLHAIESGETVDREAFLADHPEMADELRDCLEALEFVDGGARQGKHKQPAKQIRDEWRPLSAIGDYRIIREIGRGGMGVVYEAEQLSIGRKVALKVLPFAAVLNPKNLKRFKHEAQAAGALKHPHIVGVHAVGCERGVHYYAMELVEGQSLAQLIANQQEPAQHCRAGSDAVASDVSTAPIAALSTKASSGTPEYFRAVARLGVQAAEALNHAHDRGIVHRDVKPSNLMIDGAGNLWVTDFGLAQMESDATRLTMSGDVLGTLRYMSPEQATGDHRRLDHRSDIYSLGVTLFELLTGRPAFAATDRVKLIRDIVEGDPPAPRKFNAAIPRDLETIVLKATSKEPAARYATASALAADLQSFLEDKPIQARRPNLAHRLARWCRRNRSVAILSVCLLVSLISCLFVLAQQGGLTSPSVSPRSSELGLRLVHRGEEEVAGNLSPDGGRLVYPNWNTANLALFDIQSGGRRDLTTDGNWEPGIAEYGEQAVWSHDGRRMAFNWYGGSKNKATAQLRIMAADGTGQRIVFQPKKRQIVWPVGWSGDGRQVLVQLSEAKDQMAFVLVDVGNATTRHLQTFKPPLPKDFQLSLDARMIVFSRSPSPDESEHDLFLLDTESREISPLIDHVANDYAPFWTPDGRWIVFLSDRGGTTRLWGIRIRDGQPLGEPRLIFSRLPDIAPKGFDKQGAYYYAAWQSRSNVYTAEVDFANNAVIGSPQVLESKHEGRNTDACWSPDGTRLAYLSRLGPQRLTPMVTIRDLESSRDTELLHGAPIVALHRYSSLRWLPNEDALWLTAVDSRELPAWFQIDAASGGVTRPNMPDVPAGPESWWLAPDGEEIFHRSERQVHRIDMSTGEVETIHQIGLEQNDIRGMAVSPDGRQLAISLVNEEIRLLSVDGKEIRVLYRKDAESALGPASWCLTWTPDGKRLVFGMASDDQGELVSLWQLPVDGGQPQALGITMPRLRSLRVHPDGRRILFIARTPGPTGELWALDNVLAYLNSLD